MAATVAGPATRLPPVRHPVIFQRRSLCACAHDARPRSRCTQTKRRPGVSGIVRTVSFRSTCKRPRYASAIRPRLGVRVGGERQIPFEEASLDLEVKSLSLHIPLGKTASAFPTTEETGSIRAPCVGPMRQSEMAIVSKPTSRENFACDHAVATVPPCLPMNGSMLQVV